MILIGGLQKTRMSRPGLDPGIQSNK